MNCGEEFPRRRPAHLELWVSIGLLVVMIAVALALWVYLGSASTGIIVGVPLGILSGILLLFVVYFAQLPGLVVSLADDRYDPKFEQYYLHLKVTNTSWGFLGGGVASDCRGTIQIDGKSYTPKWATRPEPLITTGFTKRGDLLFPVGQPQSWLMELAKSQDIAPGQVAFLDVAMKQKGDEKCYIHEAENYWHPDHKHNPLPPGIHPFVLTLACRGRTSIRVEFTLVNGAGTDPASLRIEQRGNQLPRSRARGSSKRSADS